MRSSRHVALPLLAAVLLLAVSACARSPRIAWAPDGGSYTMAQAGRLAARTDISAISGTPESDARDLRQRYLTSLRSHGKRAAALADHLTRDFPVDSSSVPVRVEAATVDDRQVWIVIEAWAEKGGTLAHRRLWLLDRADYSIVGSSSYR